MASEPVKKVPIPPRGVDYRGKVVLAPMVRSGELPSRLLALHYGADLVWGPETVDRSMIGTTRRINPSTKMIEWSRTPSNNVKAGTSAESIIFRIDPCETPRLIFQLGTSDPDRAVAAARLVAADVAGIDVNAGCPKPFSTHDGMGAALLRTPDKLVSILEALTSTIPAEFGIGVSVKIRLLETAAETEALVRRLVGTGITGLTVHCRTTPMRPREPAIRGQLRMVGEVCREAGVACLMNGDVEGRDHAMKLIQEFGVDGAMIARAAEKDPSVFRGHADGGLAKWEEIVPRYVEYALKVGNKFGNTKFMLAHLLPGKTDEIRQLSPCKNYAQTVEMLKLKKLRDLAAEVDDRLGISSKGKAAVAEAAALKKRKWIEDLEDAQKGDSQFVVKMVKTAAPKDPEADEQQNAAESAAGALEVVVDVDPSILAAAVNVPVPMPPGAVLQVASDDQPLAPAVAAGI